MQTYHIIGDIHGCFQEFVNLTKLLGFEWKNQIPMHPNGDRLVFVGDLTDRGKNSLAVIDVVYELVIRKKIAYYAPGNHCNKLYRYFIGRNVQIKHGLETTVAELDALSSKQYNHYKEKFIKLYEGSPLYHMLDQRKLIVCHAGIKEEMIGKTSNSVKTFVLYGDITGEVLPNGMPVRRDWAKEYTGESIIVYGHTPILEPRVINKTYNIDTGAVFGGHLTALSYPSLTFTKVKSSMPFLEEKFTHFE
ncbi:bis(5'-nucleosyl)-tetraphosphatase PrpE [Bacillus sp. RG28]|uniref:Bis(5'-nucleosyl)-tetraphosphatase PrpE n=1 Tax=Gottfriedia endophytica TaxID=2820819 RepID=A0A940SG20_9BACI|nr:bis(5'-nucleosyl)-tetraphosphatase PrpE [Gottfriedia endophytica]MBP0724607.1 bis(5'-nucleosyl)-tetraphosphatase PrpE [Gottfriedia endophytica]